MKRVFLFGLLLSVSCVSGCLSLKGVVKNEISETTESVKNIVHKNTNNLIHKAQVEFDISDEEVQGVRDDIKNGTNKIKSATSEIIQDVSDSIGEDISF